LIWERLAQVGDLWSEMRQEVAPLSGFTRIRPVNPACLIT
jgi:hypothetical protein